MGRKPLMLFIITHVSFEILPFISSSLLNISSRPSVVLFIKSNAVPLKHDFSAYGAGSVDLISCKTCLVKWDLKQGYCLMLPSKCGKLTL